MGHVNEKFITVLQYIHQVSVHLIITEELDGHDHVYIQENVLVFGSNDIQVGNVHTILYVIVCHWVLPHHGTVTGSIANHCTQDTVTADHQVGAVSNTQIPDIGISQVWHIPLLHTGWLRPQQGTHDHQFKMYHVGHDSSDVHTSHQLFDFVIVIACVPMLRSSHLIHRSDSNCSWHLVIFFIFFIEIYK